MFTYIYKLGLLCITLLILMACNILLHRQESKQQGIYYSQSIIESNNPLLIFIHGWCTDRTIWKNQVEFFSKRYNVVFIDLPGHGNSDSSMVDWSVQNLSATLLKFINKKPYKSIIVIGHSMGGSVALHAALHTKDKIIGFVGIDIFKELDYRIPNMGEFNNWLQSMGKDFNGVVSDFVRQALFLPDSDKNIIQEISEKVASCNQSIAIEIMKKLVPYYEHEKDYLAQLTLTTNLINSSTPNNIEAIKKYTSSNYKMRIIENTGHYPMLEKPNEFNLLLEETIENILN